MLYCPTQWDSQGLLALEALSAVFMSFRQNIGRPRVFGFMPNCFLSDYDDVVADVRQLAEKIYFDFPARFCSAYKYIRGEFSIKDRQT